MPRSKTLARTALYAVWEWAAALGVYFAGLMFVFSCVMALIGGPSPFVPNSIATFSMAWESDKVPAGVQTGLFVFVLLGLGGLGVCAWRRRLFLPAIWAVTDSQRRNAWLELSSTARRQLALTELGDLVAMLSMDQRKEAFRSLPADLRRAAAWEEIGDLAAALSIEERYALAERLVPEWQAAKDAEKRLREEREAQRQRGVARALKLGERANAERREAEERRQRVVGGVELSPDELSTYYQLREKLADGQPIENLLFGMSEPLRQAVLRSGDETDGPLRERVRDLDPQRMSLMRRERALLQSGLFGAGGAAPQPAAAEPSKPSDAGASPTEERSASPAQLLAASVAAPAVESAPQRVSDIAEFVEFETAHTMWLTERGGDWRGPAVRDAMKRLRMARSAIRARHIALIENLADGTGFRKRLDTFDTVMSRLSDFEDAVLSKRPTEIARNPEIMSDYGGHWRIDLAAWAGVDSDERAAQMIERIEAIDGEWERLLEEVAG